MGRQRQSSSKKQVVATTFVNPTKQGGPVEMVATIEQLDGNDQAVAKRAQNETMSPHGGHKRPRLDQSHKIYAQAASASLNVAITCNQRGFISQGVSDQVLAAIQKQIIRPC